MEIKYTEYSYLVVDSRFALHNNGRPLLCLVSGYHPGGAIGYAYDGIMSLDYGFFSSFFSPFSCGFLLWSTRTLALV